MDLLFLGQNFSQTALNLKRMKFDFDFLIFDERFRSHKKFLKKNVIKVFKKQFAIKKSQAFIIL